MNRQFFADLIRTLLFFFCTVVFPDSIQQRVVTFWGMLCSQEAWMELVLTTSMLAMAVIALNELRSILAAWQWAVGKAPPRSVLTLAHVESLVDHCTDPISLDVLEKPVILSCGHAINEQSLATLQRMASPMQCPVCKQSVQFHCRSFALQNVVEMAKRLKGLLGIDGGRSW
jgi:hypothetical protein